MPTDLTGTPTSLGIGTFNVDADAPSGLGFNEAMAQIDSLIAARVATPGGIVNGQSLLWNGTSWTVYTPKAPTIQIFTTGTGTYTTPANIKAILVEAIGGGGGGGGASSTGAGQASGGNGGGGGAYARKLIFNPAASYAYVVGGGGGGGGAIAGSPGSDTTFGATVVVAKAGSGGGIQGVTAIPSYGSSGGIGGSGAGSTGDVTISGGNGSPAIFPAAAAVWGGEGGETPGFSPRTPFGAVASGANGAAGANYGGGGAGAVNSASQGPGRTGGNGAGGLIIVTEFYL